MSNENIEMLNLSLGIAGVALQVVILSVLVLLAINWKNKKPNVVLGFIRKNFFALGFLLSVVPLLASLFYSEVLGYLPCYHCWIQRIFLYPQTFLFAVAWIRKDRNVFWYSWPLLLIGTIDALYLNYKYYFSPFTAPCDASGVSCAKQFVSVFGGYISIPSLALTGFISLIVLLLVSQYYKNENEQ